MFLNRLYWHSACTTKSLCLSHCVAVFGRFCWLPPGPSAVHDEIPAGPEADKQAEASEWTLCSVFCCNSALQTEGTAGETHPSTCVRRQWSQHVRLCLLPGQPAGRRGRTPGARAVDTRLPQQRKESGLGLRLLWGFLAWWRRGAEEDQKRASLLLRLPPHKQRTFWTNPAQINLRRLPGALDLIWGR